MPTGLEAQDCGSLDFLRTNLRLLQDVRDNFKATDLGCTKLASTLPAGIASVMLSCICDVVGHFHLFFFLHDYESV